MDNRDKESELDKTQPPPTSKQAETAPPAKPSTSVRTARKSVMRGSKKKITGVTAGRSRDATKSIALKLLDLSDAELLDSGLVDDTALLPASDDFETPDHAAEAGIVRKSERNKSGRKSRVNTALPDYGGSLRISRKSTYNVENDVGVDDDNDSDLQEDEDEDIVAGEGEGDDNYLLQQALDDLERLGEDADLTITSSETGEFESEELGDENSDEVPPEDELEIHDDEHQRHRRRSKKRSSDKGRSGESLGEDTEWVDPEYHGEEFVSGPLISGVNTGLKHGMLRFYYSYGYDTHRVSNIQSLDAAHVVYISGNYLHFYNIPLKKIILMFRSASGYGFGQIAIHPSRKYLAVGEKGDKPFIIIYTWPDPKVFRVLRKGTMRGYAFLDFSPNGELLCSQGMEPDCTFAIWDWLHEKRIVRQKGSPDVHRAGFSLMTPTNLTTSGLGHIQFWKMSESETGPQVLEEFGDFGMRDPCDILGFAGVAEGRVVSGSAWGNLLVWDGATIIVEISQKEGKKCHGNEITDIQHQDSEMLTIGKDGFVRVWETELLELAAVAVIKEPNKEPDRIVEVEPLLELNLGSQYKPLSAIRIAGEKDSKNWFIQDTWGKVWWVDISAAIASTEYSPKTLFFAPAGPINGIGVSTKFSVMVVGTGGGHLWAFEYIKKTVIARKAYVTPISKILWLPPKHDRNGQSFLVGFEDGTVRVMTLNALEPPAGEVTGLINEFESGLSHELALIQTLKFHKGRVTVMKIDEPANILYTCGVDRVIFGSSILWNQKTEYPVLVPLSFVTAPFVVLALDLHPFKNYRFIIAGRGGRVAECRRPTWDDIDTTVSYNHGKLHGRRWLYKSVKSALRHEESRQKRNLLKAKELDDVYKHIQVRREIGIVVDEDLEVGRVIERYRRQQAKEDELELHIPPTPCPILGVYYHINPKISGTTINSQTFFLHVGDFDAGYIYECKYNRPDPGGFHAVPPTPPFTHDVAINCFLVSPDDKYLLFGMMDGSIRVMPRAYHPTPTITASNARHESILPSTGTGSGSSSDEADGLTGRVSRKKSKKVVIPPFPVSDFPYDLQKFWTLSMHDPDRGAVAQMAWSFDRQFLISVGHDGSIFAYRWDPHEKLKAPEDNLPEPLVPIIPRVAPQLADIEVLDALTLEELKIKAEADRIFELTEGTKEIIRRQLRKLRLDFRAIAQKNDEIPLLFRVPRAEFALDPRIKASRQVQFQDEIEKVYRKYEWDGIRSVIACEKIQKHFLDTIETHHRNVKDLEHTVEVHTFRHRFLTPAFLDVCRMNQEVLASEKAFGDEIAKFGNKNTGKSKSTMQRVKRFYAKDLIGEYAGKKYDVKTAHAIRQLEDLLQKRYTRECEWAQLNVHKVADDYEAPEDVEAIRYAIENMGDYKLKTGEDYLLYKTATIAERRQKVLELKIRIYNSFQEYNGRVKVLQEEKISVIESCRKLEHEIQERHKYLPTEMRVSVPRVHDIEFVESPESLFQISNQDVADRQNQKLEAAGLLKRKKIAYGEESEEVVRGATPVTLVGQKSKAKRRIYKPGDFIRGRNDPRGPKVVLKKLEQAVSAPQSGPAVKLMPKRKELEGLSSAVFRYRKAFFNPKTEAAQRRRDRILARRSFERDYILEQLHRSIDYFKQRVMHVRNERIELQLDVKLMTIGMLAYIQELDIVKEDEVMVREGYETYEKQKVDLEVAKRKAEKAKRRLNAGKKEQKKVEDLLTKLAKEVSTLIYDQGRFSEFLWRLFRKRVRIATAGEDHHDDQEREEDEEEEEEKEEEEGEEGEDGSREGLELQTSHDKHISHIASDSSHWHDHHAFPEDLEEEIYDKVCELGEKKAYLDADLWAQKQIVDKLTNESNECNTQVDDFEERLSDLEEQINSLQRQRQTLINNLRKLVILKVNQVHCIEEDKLEMDNHIPILERLKRSFPKIEDVIVFPNDGIYELDQKIDELKEVIRGQKKKQQRTRHMMVRLREELRKKETRVKILLEACAKDMVGRFGRVVDMEAVCAGSVNLEIIDLMEALDAQRKVHYAERDQLNKNIMRTRHDLASVTTVNSEFNTMLAMLEERQRDVDFFLHQQRNSEAAVAAAAAKEAAAERGAGDSEASYVVDNEDVIEEMYSYEDRVINQEVKISYLRDTIANCRFKGAGIPEIAMMTSIPDNVATKFMTLKELQEYKSYLNKEVETLFRKNNTEQLLQSTSVMPSFNASRSIEVTQGDEQEGESGGQEQEILHQLDAVTRKSDGAVLADFQNGVEEEMTEDEELEDPMTEIDETEEYQEETEEYQEEMGEYQGETGEYQGETEEYQEYQATDLEEYAGEAEATRLSIELPHTNEYAGEE